jgi:hypothetical protein
VIIRVRLLPRLKMDGAFPPFLVYAFMAYMWTTLPCIPLHYLLSEDNVRG